jgi:GDP-D-mannose 3', 5'-epimerase
VRGRNSHNELIGKMLDWKPSQSLRAGLEKLYPWIEAQVATHRRSNAYAAC